MWDEKPTVQLPRVLAVLPLALHLVLDYVRELFERGVADGDVILHALTDALLGAGALGDIGQHFPDTDPKHKNQASSDFLLHAQNSLSKLGYQIANIDITVVAQVPRLAPYILEMRQHMATLLQLELNQVNIKATTTEKLGFTGRKEGIACYAVGLIYQP
jgi:2-C-methyl-D-erythritol 2,4-cyclodiphosphate synthase